MVGSKNVRYFISEKHPFAVISIAGTLVKRFLLDLEDCQAAIEASDARVFIFCFDDLEDLDIPGARLLARFQMIIRRKKADVLICSLHGRFARVLEDQGALRRSELCDDLRTALGMGRDQRPSWPPPGSSELKKE